MYLSLKGNIYPNNSVISVNKIGKTDTDIMPPSQDSNNGLQCITDKKLCCRGNSTLGQWYFPNGTIIQSQGVASTETMFYRNKGRHNNGTVNLNRAMMVTSPTGLFCCEVLDANDEDQTLCVNLGKYMTVSITVSSVAILLILIHELLFFFCSEQ